MQSTSIFFLIFIGCWVQASPSNLLLARQPADLSGLATMKDASDYYPGACETFAGFPTGLLDYQLLEYVNGLMITQLQELNSQLESLKNVLENDYDPNNEANDLGSYIDAIRAFCGGRKCTECDCASPDSGCSEGDCSLDPTCTPFSELITIETALLDAIAAVNPGDSCLNAEYCV